MKLQFHPGTDMTAVPAETVADVNRAQWMLWHVTGLAVPTRTLEPLK